MKIIHKLNIVTFALIGFSLFLGSLFFTTKSSPLVQGATGSRFTLNTAWLTDQASTTLPRSLSNTGLTTSPVGTTTPNEIFFTANSTTTITLVTAGISDIRLNFMANATSGPNGGPLTVSFLRSIIGTASSSDLYPDSVLAIDGISGAATQNPLINVNLATTTDMSVNLNSRAPAASIHLKNINAPQLKFSIGTNAAIGLSLEVVTARPN